MSEKIKEYIEREAAIELGKKQSCAGIIDGGDFCNISANMLRNIPAADVVEVRHGEWIVDDAASEHCSCCGHKFYISALFAIGGNDEPNCCPNCGAKMDGGADDAAD